ncbi:MAG: ATP-binding cassette domain-containing protein, partial [Hyphomicrobiales bacterium]
MAEVRIDRVSKSFGRNRAVRDLSLTIGDGEFVVLLGPTGAGKTTTLRLVAGLERPDDGRVHIGGRDMTLEPPAVRDVTFVFQQYSLYPHLTVFENLAFPLRSPTRRMAEDEIRRKVHAIAEMLRIAGGPERLRPHLKTHKLPELIRRQVELGITKFKCATIAEAEMAAA